MLVSKVGKYLTIETDGKGGGRITKAILNTRGTGTGADALESFILALACAGVDVSTPVFVEALETALDAIENNS